MNHVHIETNRCSGNGTVITTDEGEQVHGVRSATIRIEPNKVNKATLEFAAHFSGGAFATYHVPHPRTGSLKQVARIQFGDGEVWTYLPDPIANLCDRVNRSTSRVEYAEAP